MIYLTFLQIQFILFLLTPVYIDVLANGAISNGDVKNDLRRWELRA